MAIPKAKFIGLSNTYLPRKLEEEDRPGFARQRYRVKHDMLRR